MRIVFECYAIYSAVICTILCAALAFGLMDDHIEWVARKVINISFLIYGPILFTVCLYGLSDIKALAKICTLHGISPHTNYVSLFVLFSTLFFSIFVCMTMAMEKTIDMAEHTFTNESSIIFRITQMYFNYANRSRESRIRERRADRRFRREEHKAE